LLKIRGNGIETKINEDFIFEFEDFKCEFLRIGTNVHVLPGYLPLNFLSLRESFWRVKTLFKSSYKTVECAPGFFEY
jgi:hypothetical protein